VAAVILLKSLRVKTLRIFEDCRNSDPCGVSAYSLINIVQLLENRTHATGCTSTEHNGVPQNKYPLTVIFDESQQTIKKLPEDDVQTKAETRRDSKVIMWVSPFVSTPQRPLG